MASVKPDKPGAPRLCLWNSVSQGRAVGRTVCSRVDVALCPHRKAAQGAGTRRLDSVAPRLGPGRGAQRPRKPRTR